MKLRCLGSNSSGNCYLLIGANEALVLECGVPLREVKKALNFDISRVVGAVVSHEHGDHAGYVREYAEAGITVLSSEYLFRTNKLSILCAFAKRIEAGKGYKIGGFKVMPFSVAHDVPCFGFLIEHAEMGKLLFLTDTMLCEYTFQGLNHVLIECNYSDEILQNNINAGRVRPEMRPRLMQSHMELETCKGILKANDLTAVQSIVLIHLSDGNSNEKVFINEVQAATGKPTYAANKGFEISLSKML